MKKLILLMLIAITAMDFAYQKAKNYVWTGQMYLTARHNFLEKMNGKVKEMTIYGYQAREENGKIVKGKFISAAREEYNEFGAVLSTANLDSTGKINSYIWSTKAEAQGRKLIKAMYYLRDTLRAYSKNIYTGDNLTEVKYFNPENDTLYMSLIYTYDQNGLRTKWQALDYKNKPQSYAEFGYSPDEVLKLVKIFNAQGVLTAQYDWYFSDKGIRISSHEQNLVTGSVLEYKYKYEYDKHGNWIKMLFYRDDKLAMLRERELKYYD